MEEGDTITVSVEEAGIRLDKLLSQRFPRHSRTYFQYLIEEGLVLINSKVVKKREKVDADDEIEIQFSLTPEIDLTPQDISLNILFEDDALIAINKPPGLVTHPGAGNWSNTLVNGLLYHCKNLPFCETLRPGIVHRLDKDTSGILIAAKTEEAQKNLTMQFASRLIKKEYLAICFGKPKNQLIENHIGRHPFFRKEMAVVDTGGKKAVTRIELIGYKEPFSLVRLFPLTGRTHQLRVHLKSIGCPIVGDSIYGNLAINKKYAVDRQLLHADFLSFTHPVSGELLSLKAPLPPDMESWAKSIEF